MDAARKPWASSRCVQDKGFSTLQIEKTGAVILRRDRAGIVASEDAVTVAGDEAVFPIAEGARQKLKKPSPEAPEAAELLEDKDDCV